VAAVRPGSILPAGPPAAWTTRVSRHVWWQYDSSSGERADAAARPRGRAGH